MTFEISQIIKSKEAFRKQLAARPVAEKLRVLEELRKRAIAIAVSREEMKQRTAVATSPSALFTA